MIVCVFSVWLIEEELGIQIKANQIKQMQTTGGWIYPKCYVGVNLSVCLCDEAIIV